MGDDPLVGTQPFLLSRCRAGPRGNRTHPANASRQCAVGTAIATTLNECGNVPIAKASVFVFGASGTVPTLNNTVPGLFGAVTVTEYDAAGTTADAVSPFENAAVIGTLPFAYTPTVGATARWRTV